MLFLVTCFLVFFPRAVSFAPALGVTKPSRLHLAAVEKDHQPHEMFAEEIEWTQKGELKVMPNDEWITKEFKNVELNNAEHHEWFSEGVEPTATKTVPVLDKDDKKNHQHEWFAEEIEWMEKPEPLVKPQELDKRDHHEWFSEAVTPKRIVATPVAKKEDIQRDHEHEWYTYQLHWFPLKSIAPLEHHDWFQDALEMFPPTKVPQAAPGLDQKNLIGREWFTDAMVATVPVKPHQHTASSNPIGNRNEWFSDALENFDPVKQSSLPKKITGNIRGADWFSDALQDFTPPPSKQIMTSPAKMTHGKQDLGHHEWFTDAIFD